ncbi:serine/arginine-rich splicing factor RS31 isoform X1 [Capsicum annuum]|uniref:serine/arginine-rich splicing factor RS31 isoform X1 n=2 Tax=Capsicum annuum TaxID=4072 RepID=UPI0007BEC8EC|nr:serine/arginine-rich splicing factor RS31 isoform X1 [Capsicum annuum]
MRPIFCGNFDFETRQFELEKLFRRYGKVDRVDMKSGFAFVYMDDERDAEDAIRGLDRIEFGRKGRRLRVEWSKEERGRKPEGSSKSSSSVRVCKTLFVINFDPYNTRTRDLERHFDPYGKILNTRIRRNFAFIQFETQEDATRALDATNMSKLMDRVITVEYAIKDDDDRKDGYGPGKTYDRSPRRGYDRSRSHSPYGRDRRSPDYGRGRDRPSPDYGRGRDRLSPEYGRGRDGPSPDFGRGRDQLSPGYGRGPSRSPNHRERNSEYGRGNSPAVEKERKPGHGNVCSPSLRRERTNPGNGLMSSSPLKSRSPGYGNKPSPSPQRERSEKYSPNAYNRGSSPSPKLEPVGSPARDGRGSSERYRRSHLCIFRCQRSSSQKRRNTTVR